jgi:toxin YoeB
VTWQLVYTKQSQKDAKKLIGDLFGAYSRRVNIQHRLVYQIYETERIVKIIRLWNRYE